MTRGDLLEIFHHLDGRLRGAKTCIGETLYNDQLNNVQQMNLVQIEIGWDIGALITVAHSFSTLLPNSESDDIAVKINAGVNFCSMVGRVISVVASELTSYDDPQMIPVNTNLSLK